MGKRRANTPTLGRVILGLLLTYVCFTTCIFANIILHESLHFAAAGQIPERIVFTDDATPYLNKIPVQPTMIIFPTQTLKTLLLFGLPPNPEHNPVGTTVLDVRQPMNRAVVEGTPIIVATVLFASLCWLAYFRPRPWTIGPMLATALQPVFNSNHLPTGWSDSLFTLEYVLVLVVLLCAFVAWAVKTFPPKTAAAGCA